MKTLPAIAASLLSLVSTTGYASDWPDDELPVVLTASRLGQNLHEAPNAVTILDRELIEASGAIDIPELFKMVPGFLVGHFRSHRPSVTYHGFADEFPRRLQVLVDGRSVYTPSLGGVPWQRLPLTVEEIERVEVIRGPNSVSYGANAFLATINIITRHASEDDGFATSVDYGGNADHRVTARYAAKQDNTAFRVMMATRGSDGFEGQPDEYDVRMANMRLDTQLTPQDSLQWAMGFSSGEFGEGSNGDTVDQPHDADGELAYGYLRWLHTTDAGNEWNVRAAITYDKVDDTVTGSIAGFPTLLDVRNTSKRYDLEAQYTSNENTRLRYVVGGGLRADILDAPGYVAGKDLDDNIIARIFGNAEWHWTNKTTINAGLLVDYNSINGIELAPRLALNHRINQHRSVRFLATRAHRTPRVLEENLDLQVAVGPTTDTVITSAGDLDAESLFSVELGFVEHLPKYNLTLDAKIFVNQFDHEIASNRGGERFNPVFGSVDEFEVFANQGRIRYGGAEIQLDWNGINRRLFGGASYVDVYEEHDVDDPADSVPTASAFLMWIERLNPRTTVTAGAYYVGPREFQTSGNFTKQHRSVTLQLRHTIPVSSGNLTGRVKATYNADKNRDFIKDNVPEDSVLFSLIWETE